MLAGAAVMASTATYDFTTDPTTGGALIVGGNGVNTQPWQASGGNPGGFLALTYPIGNLYEAMVFPDIDPGKIVTAFKFETDLRIGNSTGDRAADGFSISFARSNDPVLAGLPDDLSALNSQAKFAGGVAEFGTTTGIDVSFDTWSGNDLPDIPGGNDDIEGIIIRVDNITVLKTPLSTRHGACADTTSLQTGPRDAAYWAGAGDPMLPESWATLCWQKLSVELDDAAKLTVIYKGKTLLDHFQTTYFPSAGRLVLAGRTGGANEHTHFDNIVLTTTALTPGQKPAAPTNFKSASTGTRRVALEWDASTNRLSYEIQRNGTVVPTGILLTNKFADLDAKPGTTNVYTLLAVDVAGTKSDPATVTVTTAAEVPGPGYLLAQIYDGFTGASLTDLATWIADPKFPDSPDRARYVNGISFGEPSFGNTYGDSLGVRITGTLTVPQTGQYRFFVRSDDASQLFLNTTGAALPNPATATAIATEEACCAAFQEPGDPRTSEAIQLTAGTQYGFVYLVKEGGGGDWGQVAMRKEGDTTAAASLQPIRGPLVTGVGDPVGASVTFTQQPQSASVAANETLTLTAAANVVSPYGAASFYQWYRNNEMVPGATSSNLTLHPVLAADNNAVYKVLAGTLGATNTSSQATLTVSADTKPPTMASATGDDTFTKVTVTWSEPVVAPGATNAANYILSPSANVTSAELVDPFTVRLTTAKLTEDTEFTITATSVMDSANNVVAATNNTVKFRSWKLVSGRVKMERYNGIPGVNIADLYSDPNYVAQTPAVVTYRTGLSFGEESGFGDTFGDNYGAVLKAYLIPTETGQYNFFIRADDQAQLFLSTNATAFPVPGTDTPIASEEAACCEAFKEQTTPPTDQPFETTTTPISLTAGTRYPILLTFKEGGGGDWAQAAMRKVGDTNAAASLPPVTSLVWYFGATGGGGGGGTNTVGITRNAQGAISISYTGTLEAADTIGGPFAAVPGATNPYPVTPTGTQKYYRSRQ